MKDFKTIEEQIILLKNRGLIFKDEENAKILLLNNNYYNIINGYKEPFIAKETKDNFVNDTTFEEIYALYTFDKSLKDIFLEYILKIENNIRALIAYYFSMYNGNDNYLKLDNFDYYKDVPTVLLETKAKRIKAIQELISNIHKEIAKTLNSKNYINHYITNYGFIPLWVLINILTFGQLSKFLELMKQRERIKIAQQFNIKENDLVQYIKILAYFRNLCAHDDRIYNVTLPKYLYIPDNYIHTDLKLQKKKSMFTKGKNDLFALMITLKIMLNEDDFNTLSNKIYGRLKSLEKKLFSINIKEILDKMNFPENWRDIKSSRSTRET